MGQASRQGIYVSNIPSSDSPNALSCAEHTVYLILALLRQQNVMTETVKVPSALQLGSVFLWQLRIVERGFHWVRHCVGSEFLSSALVESLKNSFHF